MAHLTIPIDLTAPSERKGYSVVQITGPPVSTPLALRKNWPTPLITTIPVVNNNSTLSDLPFGDTRSPNTVFSKDSPQSPRNEAQAGQSPMPTPLATPVVSTPGNRFPGVSDNTKNRISRVPAAAVESNMDDSGDQSTSQRLNETNPWGKCAKLSSDWDDAYCDTLKEELENLLIFAALFSAILSAFTLESYKWFQPDSGSPLVPQYRAVVINGLWFGALATSLGASSVAILCQQWIRTYRITQVKPTQSAMILRHRRFEGLIKWHVPNIVSALPVLLHLSLLAFAIGLVYLLWEISRVVAIIFTAVAGSFMVFVLFTTVAPAVQWWCQNAIRLPRCPYQSPMGWIFHLVTSYILNTSRWVLGYKKRTNGPSNWQEFDTMWVESEKDDQVNLVNELLWLDDNVSHDVDGVRSRAIILTLVRLPIGFYKYLVQNVFKNHDIKNKTPLPILENDPLLWQAWYLAAHSFANPDLDVDCMEAKTKLIMSCKRKNAKLPEIPRRPGLNMDKFNSDPLVITQFFRALKIVAEGGGLSEDNEKEMWTLVGSILEYAIKENKYLGFDAMKELFTSLSTRLNPFRDDLPKSDARRIWLETVSRMSEGLAPLLRIHESGSYMPLPPPKNRREAKSLQSVEPLLALVDQLSSRGRDLPQDQTTGTRDQEKIARRLNTLKSFLQGFTQRR